MNFLKKDSEVYIFDGAEEKNAFKKTTHLAVAAHQDDIEFMAYHGIAECFNQKGKAFSAVVVTDGAGSPRAGVYKDYTDEDMKKIRRLEQKKAAFVGEYATLSLLMYPSSEIKDAKNKNTVEDIFSILTAAKPEFVYTHNLADKHDTHVAVALRTIAAIRKMPASDRPKKVYGCEVWRGLDWLDDGEKVKLDVGGKQNLANALMGVYDSQISGGKSYDVATTGRRVANATYADDHAVDTFTHVTYALDLTPLIIDDKLSAESFLKKHLDSFAANILQKVNKFV